MEDPLVIAGKEFSSRLMVGTGRHRTMQEMIDSVRASGTQIITVAIGRLNLEDINEKTILDYLDWDNYTILPNTAGSKTSEEAVLTARLAREVTGSSWVKLEVIPDISHLLPDPIGTYYAAKELIEDGFDVLPYIHADPVLAHRISTAFVFILYSATIWFVATRLIETKIFVLFSVIVCMNLFFHIVPVTEIYTLPKSNFTSFQLMPPQNFIFILTLAVFVISVKVKPCAWKVIANLGCITWAVLAGPF